MPATGDLPGWITLAVLFVTFGLGGHRAFLMLGAKVDNGFSRLDQRMEHSDEKHAEHKEHLKDLEGRVRILEKDHRA